MPIMDKPLVSIIIPTYKRKERILPALDSVFKQTYSNIEIIVADDNDPTSEYAQYIQELCGTLKSQGKRIFYISANKNQGACFARNMGAAKASGEYIAFLDDDDEFYSEKIEKQIVMFNDHHEKYGCIGCNLEIINEKGNLETIERTSAKGDVFYTQLRRNICTTSTALIRKTDFDKCGGFEQIDSSQEHLFFAKLFSVNPWFDYVDEILVKINHHAGERISTNRKKPNGAIQLSEHLKQFYPRLNEEQRREVDLAMNANIVNAFLILNRRKEAKPYIQERTQKYHCYNADTWKLILRYCFGDKVLIGGYNLYKKIKGNH